MTNETLILFSIGILFLAIATVLSLLWRVLSLWVSIKSMNRATRKLRVKSTPKVEVESYIPNKTKTNSIFLPNQIAVSNPQPQVQVQPSSTKIEGYISRSSDSETTLLSNSTTHLEIIDPNTQVLGSNYQPQVLILQDDNVLEFEISQTSTSKDIDSETEVLQVDSETEVLQVDSETEVLQVDSETEVLQDNVTEILQGNQIVQTNSETEVLQDNVTEIFLQEDSETEVLQDNITEMLQGIQEDTKTDILQDINQNLEFDTEVLNKEDLV